MIHRWRQIPAPPQIIPWLAQRRGFTLVELLVAISVISIAAMVFVSFYFSARDLRGTAQNQEIAASLAQEQLEAILASPTHFTWRKPEGESTQAFPILAATPDDPDSYYFDAPLALPADKRAYLRQTNLYNRFQWAAFARQAAAADPYYEITVVISWTEAGRDQSIALTSALDKGRLGELS